MTRYVTDRNDIIWLDFDPTKGKQIGKYRPAVVLSSRQYNKQTGLMICCPISTSVRGAATEVYLGKLDKPSVVASSLNQTLSWRERKAQFITQDEDGVMDQVLVRIIPLIGGR